MTQRSVADYQSAGDSRSLTKIDGKEFTIVAVEDSYYDDTPGVKITVSKPFEHNSTPKEVLRPNAEYRAVKIRYAAILQALRDAK